MNTFKFSFSASKILMGFFVLALSIGQPAFAQNETMQAPGLLESYYNLKDALVQSNANLAATSAKDFTAALATTDEKIVSAKDQTKLKKEATAITESNSVADQRKQFETLSEKMVAIAHASKLSTGPVYEQYCPMKKASWLSKEATIKNPYYGSGMLKCGSVKSTL